MEHSGSVIAGRPLREVEIPAAVQQVAAGRLARPVWENELGGLTFEVGTRPGRWFVKWAPANGHLDPRRWQPDHSQLSVDEALALIADAPPVDHLVVCHGDACAPNTLIGDDGACVGHVDLGP